MKIRKGDTIKIRIGKDASKSGKVLSVDKKANKLLVEGLNMFKKHVRPKRQGEKGEIVSVPRPMSVSNVMLVCPNCKKSVRVGYRIEGKNKSGGTKKVRICKKCQGSV